MEQNSCSCSLDAMDFKVEPEGIFNEQVHVKKEVVECLKEEAEWEDSAADVASLYAGHEVKDELVLGPEGLQPRDIAFTLFAAQSAIRAQPKLKVRLERIDNLEAPLGTDTRRDKRRVGNNADVGHETHSSNDISNEKETYVCDICKKRFDLKTQLMEHVMIHIHQSTEQEEINVADNVPVKEEVVECLKEEAEWEALAVREQPVLRDCAVRLERIDSLEALLEGTRRVEHNADVDNRIHTTTNIATEKEVYVCDICKKRFDLKTQLVEHVMTHIHRRTEREASMRGVDGNALKSMKAHVKEEVVECLKEEAEWEDSAADVASLYAGHEVKDELVLGPEGLQPRDIAFTLFAAQASAVRAQPKLKDCVVRLERIDDLEAPLGTDTRRDKRRVGNNVDVGHETHSSNDISNEKETYVCDICKKRFDLKTQLMEHVMIHIHQSTEQEEISVADDALAAAGGRGERRGRMSTGKRLYSCEICNKNFTLLGYLKKHERMHSGVKSFSCRTCNKKFTQLSSLKRHELIHTGVRPYSCDICEKDFTQSGHLKEHERIHSGDKPFSCKTCNKKFTQLVSLKTHERLHSGEKPFSCKTCNKKFTQSGSLKEHERIHTGEKCYSCDICNMKFTKSCNLKTHERIHSGAKPFSCKTCNKIFTHLSSLKTHERIHTGERPFSCGKCQRKFARSSILKTHERIHTGERPFSCGICQRKFARSSILKTHERIHTGVKPFTCGVCQQKFAQSSHLKTHERTHARAKPYICSLCKEQFKTLQSLKKHTDRIHARRKPFCCDICQKRFAQKKTLVGHIRRHMTSNPVEELING